MQILPFSESPRRLVLLRHGRTEWNRVGRAQGHADVSLDEVGRAQAEVAAVHLSTYRPAFVRASDLARARETAEMLVAVTGQPIVFDPRLREYDVGVRQGLTFAEFEDAFPGVLARFRAGERPDIPGAETDDEVRTRMVAALNDAVTALGEHETGIVVGHGASLRTGLLAFLGAPADMREMIAGMANCAWAVLEQHRDRGWQIVDYNAQTLPDPVELADDLGSR